MSEAEFKNTLFDFLNNIQDENLRTRKNIVEFFKDNYSIGKSKVHSHLKFFIDNSIIIDKNHLIYFV